ncbi:hypothetical protein PAAG_11324 [Paracoccidioides lutzii Pb01]|uniref:Uncharacterized protein n=1 Tax=Paracoccidioides lutzii (strain ATCC MYA-826 / Pb01) TaxID=502779 RepID=A0A0A2V359_PARBA|nr:hypothetical protein PAAG_11324 [Paracoccidioides lutzii Pb01]KGQ01933.1 hypothetical protein PAAG_11324 [Paracoccidioides lutzii Pb01]
MPLNPRFPHLNPVDINVIELFNTLLGSAVVSSSSSPFIRVEDWPVLVTKPFVDRSFEDTLMLPFIDGIDSGTVRCRRQLSQYPICAAWRMRGTGFLLGQTKRNGNHPGAVRSMYIENSYIRPHRATLVGSPYSLSSFPARWETMWLG